TERVGEMFLPGTDPCDQPLRIAPDECRPATVAFATHAFQRRTVRRRVESKREPLLVSRINTIRYPTQFMIHALHACIPVAKVASSEQDDLLTVFIGAIIQPEGGYVCNGSSDFYEC